MFIIWSGNLFLQNEAGVFHFQNEVQLKPGKNQRIYSMGRKCFLHIVKCDLGDSGLYVCEAGEAKTSCSVEIYGNNRESVKLSSHLSVDCILSWWKY